MPSAMASPGANAMVVGGDDVLGLATCGYGTERAVFHGINGIG